MREVGLCRACIGRCMVGKGVRGIATARKAVGLKKAKLTSDMRSLSPRRGWIGLKLGAAVAAGKRLSRLRTVGLRKYGQVVEPQRREWDGAAPQRLHDPDHSPSELVSESRDENCRIGSRPCGHERPVRRTAPLRGIFQESMQGYAELVDVSRRDQRAARLVHDL